MEYQPPVDWFDVDNWFPTRIAIEKKSCMIWTQFYNPPTKGKKIGNRVWESQFICNGQCSTSNITVMEDLLLILRFNWLGQDCWKKILFKLGLRMRILVQCNIYWVIISVHLKLVPLIVLWFYPYILIIRSTYKVTSSKFVYILLYLLLIFFAPISRDIALLT